MNVVRWQFRDMRTSEVYTVELNPNEMSNFRFPKELDFALYGGSRMRGSRATRQPQDWTFGGVVRTKTHHDALVDWHTRPGKVRITDHLGRTFEVMLRSLDLTDRRPSGDNTWRFKYTFNCLLLRRVA